MVDKSRPRCRGTFSNGGRSFHFLVQIPCESAVNHIILPYAELLAVYSSFFLLFLLQNFKREEQNFVVMNEINNMSFLTADSKSKMSKVRVNVKKADIIRSFICLLHILSCNSFETKI